MEESMTDAEELLKLFLQSFGASSATRPQLEAQDIVWFSPLLWSDPIMQ